MKPVPSLHPLIALLCLLPGLALAQAAALGPREVVRETVDDVIRVLNDESVSVDERARRIEGIAYARFDFDTMSRLVLARNWKRFDGDQRVTFKEEFKRFLANNYRARIDGYEQERVEILSERKEPRGDVTVRTRIMGGNYDGTNIDYRLRNGGKGWLVIDVVIEGISLVANFRDQFRDVMGREGPVTLIDKLKEKNASHGA